MRIFLSLQVIAALTALTTLASANPSETIFLHNDSDSELTLHEPGTLGSGDWIPGSTFGACVFDYGPPQTIPPHTCVSFGSEGGAITGTDGNVNYDVARPSVSTDPFQSGPFVSTGATLHIDWDNTYWDQASSAASQANGSIKYENSKGMYGLDKGPESSDGNDHAYDTFYFKNAPVDVGQLANFPPALKSEYDTWKIGRVPVGQPGSGIDFLRFHRTFMRSVKDWYLAQPGADASSVQRWTTLDALNGGGIAADPRIAQVQTRILTNSPPFASADDLGIYIETQLLQWMHDAASTMSHDPAIASTSTPDRALFYKIHGLVDFWWSQWLTKKDYDHDGKTDLLWHNPVSGDVVYWSIDKLAVTANADVSSFNAGVPYLVQGTDWEIVGSGDFTGDGQTDILWRHVSTGQLHVWKMNGTKRVDGIDVGPPVPDANWQVQGTGDFDGDGQLDILWRHTSGEIHVWTMNGTTRTNGIDIDTNVADGTWMIKGTGDFDGDGNTDILWHRYTTGQVEIWKMDRFHVASAVDVDAHVSDVNWQLSGVGDFDDDGSLDIVWLYEPTGQTHVWTMNGTARTGGINLGPTVSDHEWQIVGDGKPRFPVSSSGGTIFQH